MAQSLEELLKRQSEIQNDPSNLDGGLFSDLGINYPEETESFQEESQQNLEEPNMSIDRYAPIKDLLNRYSTKNSQEQLMSRENPEVLEDLRNRKQEPQTEEVTDVITPQKEPSITPSKSELEELLSKIQAKEDEYGKRIQGSRSIK